MQRTRHGSNGASPLITVLGEPEHGAILRCPLLSAETEGADCRPPGTRPGGHGRAGTRLLPPTLSSHGGSEPQGIWRGRDPEGLSPDVGIPVSRPRRPRDEALR